MPEDPFISLRSMCEAVVSSYEEERKHGIGIYGVAMRFLLFFVLGYSSSAWAFDGTGLEVSLAGDLVFDQGLNDGSSAADKLSARGTEIMFYAPVDHRFDGVLSAAAHDENGETVFELHELFLASSKLIPRGRFKVGQFFLGIGRLNQVHQHDWPFIRAPKVHETFFDSEGVFDSGAEFGYLLPSARYIDVSFGVTSGYRYGHAHTAGSKPIVPTHYMRVETFSEFSNTEGLKLGANYLKRTDEQKNEMIIGGLDLVAKWRRGKQIAYLLQSELWHRTTKDADGDESRQVGMYVFNQFGLNPSTTMGFNVDAFKDLSKINAITEKNSNNISYRIAPQVTWASSEFVKIRAGFAHSFTREEGKVKDEDSRFEMQFIFIMGAHPAHSF